MNDTKNAERNLESTKSAADLREMLENLAPGADVVLMASNVATGDFSVICETSEGDITAGEELGPGTFVLIGWKGNIPDLDYETVRYK